jgi:hypothetical protein
VTSAVVKAVVAFVAGVAAVWSWGQVVTENLAVFSSGIVEPQLLRTYSPPWIIATIAAATLCIMLITNIALGGKSTSVPPQLSDAGAGGSAQDSPGEAELPDQPR